MSTAIRSAADMLDVGWPDPAAVLARTESTRSCWASSKTSARSEAGPTRGGAMVICVVSDQGFWDSRAVRPSR